MRRIRGYQGTSRRLSNAARECVPEDRHDCLDPREPGKSVSAAERTRTARPRSPVKDEHQIAGTVIGALAGGLLGNQVGGGSGKKVATVAGAAAGGYAGKKVQENMQASDTYNTTETRCTTVTDTSEKVVGYDVEYRLGDQVGRLRMDYKPGPRIPVKDGQLVLTGEQDPA